MSQRRVQVALLAHFALISIPGCSFYDFLADLSDVPRYKVDEKKVGSGEQALVPSNDPGYINGMPQDLRTKNR